MKMSKLVPTLFSKFDLELRKGFEGVVLVNLNYFNCASNEITDDE